MNLGDTFKILQGIIHILAKESNGISTGEIAKIYGISRGTALKYINILQDAGIPIYEERQRYYLIEDYFTSFSLTSEESEFLYLILERSLILHSEHWGTLRSLLLKLGNKMVAPLADYLTSRIDIDAGETPLDRHFKYLTGAIRQRREVWVAYHALNRPEPSMWLIRPHRFTGNMFSDGLYVLCYGSHYGSEFIPLSLKLSRIIDVKLTNQRFDIVDRARFTSTLGNAWSVWSSDKEPVTVRLQFEYRHYARLLETEWHDTQRIHVDNDENVHYSVEVSEPEEMIPWIRSWGSGVVVLEPESLRERILNTLRRQMLAYGIHGSEKVQRNNLFEYLWAKYSRTTGEYHLLIYHLLDVAAVAWHMWDLVLSGSQRRWLSDLLGLGDEASRNLMALLVGLHDIGKATPAFQKKVQLLYDILLERGDIKDERGDDPHGVLSAVILTVQFANQGVDRLTARQIAQVIGGHHGVWVSNTEMRNALAGREHVWRDMQNALVSIVMDVLDVERIELPNTLEESNVFAAFLSGFTTVCDWIGSNDTYFKFEQRVVDNLTYFERALEQAHNALSEMGWVGWKSSNEFQPFEQIFSFQPRAMQQAIMNICNFTDEPPRLILIEYLTGGGKTEIALYLADLIINLFNKNGVYVAMPTQATSNQMFGRFSDYLESRYPQKPINMQLIHSQADEQPRYRQMQVQANQEGNDNGLVAEQWFQNRKRSLLSPFAVGTIDQAMMAVLQVRHHFVRQYGLSHKVIIMDEIHAYDAYMNEIIQRLLNWLNALGSPMILLSATLPQVTRKRLLQQVGAEDDYDDDIPYPRLTIVNQDDSVEVHPLPAPPTKTLHIHHLDTDDFVTWLTPIYQQGGCIAVVCNTVNEAIDIAQSLRNSEAIESDDVMLFHARSAPAWRNQTEQIVLEYFGKNGTRPNRMILVATQIIEQSLDLDFDLMITKTAPIDLLIQRAGRLHRHDDRQRPDHLQDPTLIVRSPRFDENDIPDFEVDEVIYTKYILMKTWHLLQNITELHIPDEMDMYIETVYSEEIGGGDDVYGQALQAAYTEMVQGDAGKEFRGSQYRIGAPESESLIGNKGYDLRDDDHNVATRDIRPGIDIICLSKDYQTDRLPQLIGRTPTPDEVSRYLQFRVTIRRKKVMAALERLEVCPHWQRKPQLKYARPIIFEGGLYRIPNSQFTLRLTPFYGLEIIEEGE